MRSSILALHQFSTVALQRAAPCTLNIDSVENRKEGTIDTALPTVCVTVRILTRKPHVGLHPGARHFVMVVEYMSPGAFMMPLRAEAPFFER